MFIDKAKITVKAGKGGDGCVSFRREPFVPDGGPDGGDGGKGGDVMFVADTNLVTLMDFKYKRKYEAENGQNGMKKKRFGKGGENMMIKVPVGTVIIDEESGLVMKDLKHADDFCVVGRGGKGGKGNPHYKNSVRQAPNFAEAGGATKSREIILELKLIADVGLMGFPNVGKSTLLSASTSANPKIGNYHFTTLSPNLGVVEIHDTSFVMADIPGLIEGAHEGLGLGLDFLKHIERTKLIIHVVDVAMTEGRDPIEDFEKINNEIVKYAQRLGNKPQIVAANKIDAVCDEQKYQEFLDYVSEKGYKVFSISAAGRQGIYELLNEVVAQLAVLREQPEEEVYEYYDFEKDEIDETYRDVNVKKDNRVFVLEGKQLEKIFHSTNFNDMESLRYLYNYIKQKGAADKLQKMGIQEGDSVRILDYEFEYYDEY